MIRCVIIDDERPAVNVLKRYVEKFPNLELIATTTNPVTGIEIIRKEKPDVVFLDIQMDIMDGIDLTKTIGDNTKVVFCTAHFEYAVQSYDLNAVDYLLKPIEFPRFKIAVQKIIDSITGRLTPVELIADDYILVKEGERGRMQKVDIDDIIYAKAMSNYVCIHSLPRKVIAYLSLKDLEDRLPASNFVRVHRSYIVAIKQILTLCNNELILKKSEVRVPIGANYKEAFLEKLKDKLLPKK